MNAEYAGSRGTAGREILMRKPFNVLLVLGSAAALVMVSGPLAAQATADGSVNVTSASPAFPFSQNKQNEPTAARARATAQSTMICARLPVRSAQLQTRRIGSAWHCPARLTHSA